jgi:hypothetical protein
MRNKRQTNCQSGRNKSPVLVHSVKSSAFASRQRVSALKFLHWKYGNARVACHLSGLRVDPTSDTVPVINYTDQLRNTVMD